MEFNFWSLLTVLILPHLPHVLDCSWFHLTSNTIAFSGFLAVTPGRQVGCKIRLPCVYLHVLCKACNWHLGSINPGITARGKLEINKVDRANLASFALLLWEKNSTGYTRHEWFMVLSNNYLKTKTEDIVRVIWYHIPMWRGHVSSSPNSGYLWMF